MDKTSIVKTKPNGFIISAFDSDCGKTTITNMLLSVCTQQNILLQSYKIGADIFDPHSHCQYSNEVSLNLDSWIMNDTNIVRIINSLATGYRGIIEAWGGIFDNRYPDSSQSSTISMAKLTDWPIILIISCKDKSISQLMDNIQTIHSINNHHQCHISGVILNRVSKDNMDELINIFITNKIDIYGSVFDLKLELDKFNNIYCRLNFMADLATKYLHLSDILSITSPVTGVKSPYSTIYNHPLQNNLQTRLEDDTSTNQWPNKRFAISHDDAFFFYYKDNFKFLEEYNIEIIKFSPLEEQFLPNNIDGLILSGGFPEKYAEKLSNNISLRQDINNKITKGLLCYAECGGLMYLSQGIYLGDDSFYPMIGAIPGIVELSANLQHFGYSQSYLMINNNKLSIKGLEYHHAKWLAEYNYANLWETTTCQSKQKRMEGFSSDNIHASFVHLYFPAVRQLITHFFKL